LGRWPRPQAACVAENQWGVLAELPAIAIRSRGGTLFAPVALRRRLRANHRGPPCRSRPLPNQRRRQHPNRNATRHPLLRL